ncbi:unnamed protein product [Brassicogethes aeneus]|uniref:Uncharacterized protein n=1 Tax=Brassicogethes aeneus TaxID=1431903 RepID=A0A9P0FFP7_BRAAE|nr:unnamed protein product [Brassicogethes aeneus]
MLLTLHFYRCIYNHCNEKYGLSYILYFNFLKDVINKQGPEEIKGQRFLQWLIGIIHHFWERMVYIQTRLHHTLSWICHQNMKIL